MFNRRGRQPNNGADASPLPFMEVETAAPLNTTTSAPSRGIRVAFTRGDEIVGDSRGNNFDQAIFRALGGQASLDPSTLARAVAVSATAFKCIEYRANAVSQLPLVVNVNDERIDASRSGLAFFLRHAPRLMADTSRSADIWGHFYLRKRRNLDGFPTALQWTNPASVVEVGQPRVTEYMVWNEQTWQQDRVPVRDMIYEQVFDSRPNGTGLSKLEAAYRLIGLDFGTVTHAAAFLVNSARIDGMLTFENELSDEQMQDARQDWRANFKGATNAHKTAVMPGGAKWTPIQATPADLMLSETKRDVRIDICLIFDVDPGLVGIEGVADALSANSTYSAKEVAFTRGVALPFAETILLPALNEQWAAEDFNHEYEIVVDVGNIPALNEANLVKADTANSVRASGLYTHNEARKLVGMDEEADYLKRSPDEPLKLFQQGGITLNLFHEYTLGRAMLGQDGEVVLLNGVLIPVRRIMELANANVDRMKAPIPFSPFGQQPTPPPIAVTTPALALPEQITRASSSLLLAITFPDHAYLKAARRELSAFLVERGLKNPAWIPERAWRLDLLAFDQWSPAMARQLILNADYGDMRKLDLVSAGFAERDGRIYLTLETNEALDALKTALALDMEAAGMTPIPTALDGVCLCELAAGEAVDLTTAPLASYPLVGTNITALKNGAEAAHIWTLRGTSKAQTTEIEQWEKVVRRKGKDAPFTVRALPPMVAAFIQLGLEQAETNADIDVVFKESSEMLRSYRETRINYQQEIRAAIERARADSISARKFDGEMNSVVRRAGLQTVYDAFEDGGSPIESLDADTLTLFRAWQQETKGYIVAFKNELFKAGGITDAEVDVRVALWANKTLDDLYYTMLRQAAPGLEVMWVRDPQAESCDDCLERDGKTYTLDQLGKIGFPRDRRLACGGWFCGCSAKDKNGKLYRSRFFNDAPIVRAIASMGIEVFTRMYHVHEHGEEHA